MRLKRAVKRKCRLFSRFVRLEDEKRPSGKSGVNNVAKHESRAIGHDCDNWNRKAEHGPGHEAMLAFLRPAARQRVKQT